MASTAKKKNPSRKATATAQSAPLPVRSILVVQIDPSPLNRDVNTDITALAASIKEHGLQQAIKLRPKGERFRWMLGLDPAPSAMGFADALYRQHHDAIDRIARELARTLVPRIWSGSERTLYRGLRLEDPALHGKVLPAHANYDTLPALSFSEELDVACHFADPGGRGFPVLPLPNPVTGKLGLPPHGYVAVATAHVDDVLFHWRFALAIPRLFMSDHDDVSSVLSQREVTLRRRSTLHQELHGLEHIGAGYLATRYGIH